MRDLAHLAGRARGRRIKVGPQGEAVVSRDNLITSVRAGRRPVLFAVDGDAHGRIERELRKRYGEDYRVVCEGSGEAAMRRLQELEAAGEEVALVLADQWMPGTSGMEFLACARRLFPTAKRALLIEWGDRTAQEPILRSMAQGLIDYYVNKPWGSTDEYFHRVISEFLYDWSKARRPGFEEIRVVGDQRSPRSHDLRDLLWRNGVLHTFYAADSEQGRELLDQAGQTAARLPVVMTYDGRVLVDPSNAEIADAFGVNGAPGQRTFDVIVVGGGPAGLAAAVYGASEGLSTLVVEGEAIGGQAGTSSLIRNYLGFPWGIGGAELATRAAEQAWLFGASFRLMRRATGLRRSGKDVVVSLSDGTEVVGRTVIIATGVSYRRLGVPSLEALNDAGVFYGGAVTEAQAVQDKEVYVAGAGNSAGQAATHLAKYARHVTLVARGDTLATSMSDYLIKEIEAAENIDVRLNTRIVGGGGKGRLERLVLEDSTSGSTETVRAAALFVLIGARPHTGWLPEEVERDEEGFVFTGRDLPSYGRPRRSWYVGRLPLPMETSMSGVFAAGDVRYGSVKRVASAVGAGAIVIQSVHEYLRSAAHRVTEPVRSGADDAEIGSLL
jgi:thioredoxin reductase (NADPH)